MLSRYSTPLSLILVIIFTTACSLTPVADPTVTPMDLPLETLASIPAATSTVTATVGLVSTTTSTTSSQVVITAATGSLSIRRGPGIAYNLLGFLQDGQTGVATARDESSSWLYIPIPSYPSVFGWVSASTSYATIDGDISSLPVMSVSKAEPITIRNCTYHPVLITPINILLTPQNEVPNNQVVVLPGDYTASDQSVAAQILTMSLQEGDWVDIKTDGLGNTYTCP